MNDIQMKRQWLFQLTISTLMAVGLAVEGWMLREIINHRDRIADVEAWQHNRPDFTTKDQAALLVIQAKEEVRREINNKLDTVISGVTALQLQLVQHTSNDGNNKKP